MLALTACGSDDPSTATDASPVFDAPVLDAARDLEEDRADELTDTRDTTEDEEPAEPTLEVAIVAATSLGTDAFSANGRIQPHGAPTHYYFEYGPTADYGSATPTRSLGPQLGAYYRESWDDGLAGWRGGSGLDLVHVPEGGTSSGFVRYSEPSGTDYNHTDGIGLLHLAQYFYPGTFTLDYPSAALGGAHPDFRDARVDVWVRGVDWDDRLWYLNPDTLPFYRGDELVFWAQADVSPANDFSHMSNWAHTGFFLTGALLSGDWTQVAYELRADTNDWSYAGQNRTQERDVYVYAPLDEVLRDLDVDFFHLLLFIDNVVELGGAIDFDELQVTYRNYSLLRPSNGGSLVSAPEGAEALTDGWRNGEGHMWQSAPEPEEPLAFRWDFAAPVTVERVQIHNHAQWPSRDVEVLASSDGLQWASVATGTLAEPSAHGANFDYLLLDGLDAAAQHLEVRVLSGYRPEAWGLGEIEVFGTGAVMGTDDDWYSVTQDIGGLSAGGTVHFRLVAVQDGQTVRGEDQMFTLPTEPEVVTGDAELIAPSILRIAGRLNTLGTSGTYFFELGTDTAYGLRTEPTFTGPEITPRTFSRIIDLAHLDVAPLGDVLHYRLVFCRGCETAEPGDDTTYAGADATFGAD